MSIVLYRTVVCHMQFFKWGVSFTHCNDIIGTLFPPNFRYFFPSSEQRWEHLLFLWWLDSLVYSSFFEECFLKTLLRWWMGNMHLLKRSIITVACVSPLKYCLFVLLSESGLKLLSLYIYELWSGARSPDLLLTHARLMRHRTPTSHSLLMCEEILSALDPWRASHYHAQW